MIEDEIIEYNNKSYKEHFKRMTEHKDIFENDALLEYRYLFHSQNKEALVNNTKDEELVSLKVSIFDKNINTDVVFQFTIPLSYLIRYLDTYYLAENNYHYWSKKQCKEWLDQYTSEDSENLYCNATIQNMVKEYKEL